MGFVDSKILADVAKLPDVASGSSLDFNDMWSVV
jgi:hypothetical protein